MNLKSIALLIVVISCFLARPAAGVADSSSGDNVLIPPGMEIIKEGDVNVVVPKGGQLRQQGSVMLIETADEYSARKFEDTDARFKALEKELAAQKKEVAGLRRMVARLLNNAK